MRSILLGSLCLCAAIGCGNPQAEFTLSERAQSLIPAAQEGLVVESEGNAVEVPGLQGDLEEHFGTPQKLVAWLRLPINFGRYEGSVADVDTSASAVDAFNAKFETEPGTELDGVGLLWLSGQYAGTSVPVSGFEPATNTVSLGVNLEPPPAEGDRFVVVGDLLQKGRELFMRHCMHCHGVNGGGNGPTSQYLNPLPRDYRLGVFKFTSTRKGEKPSRADLVRTIKHGIPGTYMPSFMLQPDDEIEAIVEYVRFLAMRGELENMLVAELGDYTQKAFDESVASGEKPADIHQRLADDLQQTLPSSIERDADLIAAAWKRADDPELVVRPQKTLSREMITGSPKGDVTARWSLDEGHWTISKTEAGQQDAAPVSGVNAQDVTRFDGAELLKRLTENKELASYRIAVTVEVPRTPDTSESRERGRALFLSGRAQCATCHGAAALGNGPQTTAFQKLPGSNEEYPEPGLFDDWGHKIQPRNLTSGIYRGGRRPVDIYRRIHAGIKGTPMPPFGAALAPEEIWDLVNYVLSIPFEGPGAPSTGEKSEIAATTRGSRGG